MYDTQTCRCCGMQLLPLIVKDGKGSKTETPVMYCDSICEKMHWQYPKIFGRANRRRFFERLNSFPQPILVDK